MWFIVIVVTFSINCNNHLKSNFFLRLSDGVIVPRRWTLVTAPGKYNAILLLLMANDQTYKLKIFHGYFRVLGFKYKLNHTLVTFHCVTSRGGFNLHFHPKTRNFHGLSVLPIRNIIFDLFIYIFHHFIPFITMFLSLCLPRFFHPENEYFNQKYSCIMKTCGKVKLILNQ